MQLHISSPSVKSLSFELEQYTQLPKGENILYTSIDGREFGAHGAHHLYYMDYLTLTYTDITFPHNVMLKYDLTRDFIVMVFILEGSSKDIEEAENGAMHSYAVNEYSIAYRPKIKGSLHLPVNQHIKALRIVFDPQFFFTKVDAKSHALLQKFSKSIGSESSSRLFPGNGFITAEMHAVIQQIINTNKQGNYLRLLLESKCLELLLIILERYEELQTNPKKSKLRKEDVLIKARNFLERTEGRITLEQVARYAGSNLTTLKKEFKQHYNATIMEYRKKIKMQEMHQRILTEEFTTKEAAAIMGYKYPHHFSKAFEEEFGYTPHSLIKSLE